MFKTARIQDVQKIFILRTRIMMKTGFSRILSVMAVLLFSLHAQAQSGFGGASSADKLTVSSYLSVDYVHPGAEFYAAVKMDIQDKWHINAHIPTYDYLIGTVLNLSDHEGIDILGIKYPEPVRYKFAFADDELDVYEGVGYILLHLRASRDLEPGDYTLDGSLRVQACDDEVCLAPSNKEVNIALPVVGYDRPANQINRDIFTDEALGAIESDFPEGIADDVGEFAALFDEGNVLIAFGVIFLIGLALNLTPCVYPMLTVTVSVFGAQTDTKTMRVFFKALIYVLGIATMYSVLGVMAALSGGLFGAALQSTWVLVGIGVLFFLLALSLFGLYEIQLPYWLTSRLGGQQKAGIIGIYISGLVVGIFAAPCIGPPIIALLAFVGSRGDVLFGFLAFFILSLGLGLPYLILGTFSGLLGKLPKSGSWMEWVKRVLGIVLIGVGFFYVSLAFNPGLIYYLIPLTLLIGGLYLGFVDRSSTRGAYFPWIKRAVGTAAVAGGIMFFLAGQKPTLEWEEYSQMRVEEALRNNRPVVLYFSADWCIPCLELDRMTFTNERVIGEMQQFRLLKVDLTNFDSPESEKVRQRYNIAGVPTIVFLDEGGEEFGQIRVVGFVNANEMLSRVETMRTRIAAGAGGS
jgi:thioredoxin:protein disulfide reductase